MRYLCAVGVVALGLAGNSYGGVVVSDRNLTAKAERAPQPQYPLLALHRGITGSGIFVLRVQMKTGGVTQVLVARSTGNTLLDKAATEALIRWRLKPDTLRYFKINLKVVPPQTQEETFVKVPVKFTI